VTACPGIAAGDPFAVYPAPDGPYDAIRWEVFAEALQDYVILQSAHEPDSGLLQDIKSYRDFQNRKLDNEYNCKIPEIAAPCKTTVFSSFFQMATITSRAMSTE
jgi:hypothetical protein